MAGKNQHVVPHEDGWAVRGERSKKATRITRTQQEAIDIARRIARSQRSEIVIHGRDGRIRDKDSYGGDPHPPLAKKNQHVVPYKDGWAVRGERNKRVTRVTCTQREAIDIARPIARNKGAELIIHRPNGRIRSRSSPRIRASLSPSVSHSLPGDTCTFPPSPTPPSPSLSATSPGDPTTPAPGPSREPPDEDE